MKRSPVDIGLEVLQRELEGLTQLHERFPSLGAAFERAVELIVDCPGRVIFCGMGKSGQIGRKIASTMVSTGTPCSFLHPAEGFHGDVGIVTARDVVVAISNSGSTREVLDLVPTIRNLGARVIALTGDPDSALAREADVALTWGTVREADPTGLVPTVSAMLTLALGDALTIAAMEKRGFGPTDYRLFHPSGAIGTKLTLRVIDLLRGKHTNPVVEESAAFGAALAIVTRNTLGGVSVIDAEGRLCGILTDGDIRRQIQVAEGSVGELLERPVSECMTRTPTTTTPDTLALDALRIMEEHKPGKILVLPVISDDGRPLGLLHLHTLVQAGLTSEG